MTVSFLLIAVLIAVSPVSASEPVNPLGVDLGQSAALREANRVLEEEVKLAARPHTYVVIDLVANHIAIKGKAVDLYRIPISSWSAESLGQMTGRFSLTGRPQIARPKIDPSAPGSQEPISLLDMPTRYDLAFHPVFVLEVVPTAVQSPFRWILWQVRSYWRTLHSTVSAAWSGRHQREPRLQLTLSEDDARSFAWILVDGMALVVRRPTDK